MQTKINVSEKDYRYLEAVEINDEGAIELVNAIITQAAVEYRAAVRATLRQYRNGSAWAKRYWLERFFRSEWLETLTDVDGVWLAEKIKREEIEKWQKANTGTSKRS